jgi:hypothetical protein
LQKKVTIIFKVHSTENPKGGGGGIAAIPEGSMLFGQNLKESFFFENLLGWALSQTP